MRALVYEVGNSNQGKRKCLKKDVPGGRKERRMNVPHEEHSDNYEGDDSQCYRKRPVRPVKTSVAFNEKPPYVVEVAGKQ